MQFTTFEQSASCIDLIVDPECEFNCETISKKIISIGRKWEISLLPLQLLFAACM